MHYSPASSSSSSSSSSSRRSSPVHAASLVDPARHSPELMQLIDVKLSKPVVEYIVDCISETVDYAIGRPPSSASRTHSPYHAPFTSFVSTVLTRAEVATPTVLVALVYAARARPHLSIALEQWALERVFLGALILASKYTNDSTLKNAHWALCTGVFGKRDVGRIEREFLEVLDWELGVGEAELGALHEGMMRAAGRQQRKPVPATYLVPVRRAPAPPVPELSPPSSPRSRSSSPHSSDASMSPRTPAAPMDVVEPASTQTQTKVTGGKLHPLLRVFPIPQAHSHGRAYPVPIHVTA
ncbi:hypothetical protein B0H11DRAFT_2419877 [Mycena galericulata]|nr:hypothetical protein B0H11DRAFT_2419877 [Mycena galericulata]